MSGTQSNYNAQTPFPAQLFIGANEYVATSSSGTIALTRNAFGNYSLHLAASSSITVFIDLKQLLRIPYYPDQQLYFQRGKVVDGTQPAGIPNLSSTGLASDIYSPLTTAQPKGIAIQSVQTLYKVGTANATTISTGIAKTVFPADNVATGPTVTNILATTNLTLTSRANMYDILTNATDQAMLSLANTGVYLETVLTTSTGTIDLYGHILNVLYNYN